MASRIESRFADLRARGRRGFIPYLTAGDPSTDDTVDIARRCADAGADLLELGVPFSDPLADGPANQAAAARALAAGTTLARVLDAVATLRRHLDTPVVLYSYLNPLLAHGFDASARAIAAAGADGLLLLDLAEEESAPFAPALRHAGLDRICLVTPTSTDARVRRIVRGAGGFVYCVSRAGVTGARREFPADAARVLARARRFTRLPLALGFGISTPEQARQAARSADAVVVGSALVQRLHEAGRGGRAGAIRWLARMARAVHEG